VGGGVDGAGFWFTATAPGAGPDWEIGPAQPASATMPAIPQRRTGVRMAVFLS
jgi:hypothetical protein